MKQFRLALQSGWTLAPDTAYIGRGKTSGVRLGFEHALLPTEVLAVFCNGKSSTLVRFDLEKEIFIDSPIEVSEELRKTFARMLKL